MVSSMMKIAGSAPPPACHSAVADYSLAAVAACLSLSSMASGSHSQQAAYGAVGSHYLRVAARLQWAVGSNSGCLGQRPGSDSLGAGCTGSAEGLVGSSSSREGIVLANSCHT
jgi:hypothetical protein